MSAVVNLADYAALRRVPPAPKTLNATGKAEWRKTADLMFRRGTLRAEMLSVLEAYCMNVAFSRQYAEEAAKVPAFVETADGKGTKTHPVHALLAQSLKQVGVYSKVLGLAVGSKGRALSDDIEADRDRWSGVNVE